MIMKSNKLRTAMLLALAGSLVAAPAFAHDLGNPLVAFDFWGWIFGGHRPPGGGSPGYPLAGPGIFGLVALGLGVAIAVARRR